VTDLVEWLETAISAAEAKDIARRRADPAVLLRCQADRKILADHAPGTHTHARFCSRCCADLDADDYVRVGDVYYQKWPCGTVRLLAEGYGYQEET
jgi:hypothetical protein